MWDVLFLAFFLLAKPTLALRAAPIMGLAPLEVLLTAELKGGEDSEEFYCLKSEWQWPDGTRSSQQSDCLPYDGTIERRWTVQKRLSSPGDYLVVFRLLRGKKVVGETSLTILAK